MAVAHTVRKGHRSEREQGREDPLAVLVLDPAGESAHWEPPATWRPLADQLDILWCRLPASALLPRRTPQPAGTFHIVAAGAAAAMALDIAEDYATAVQSVLLVDPPELDESDHGDLADLGWTQPYPITQLHCGQPTHPATLGHPEVVDYLAHIVIESENGAESTGHVGARGLSARAHDGWSALLALILRIIP